MYLLKLIHHSFRLINYLFTFHYVSIKTHQGTFSSCYILHLHSTMYLLKRNSIQPRGSSTFNLHSTMYLLKQVVLGYFSTSITKFTFHYVSIKTFYIAVITSFCFRFTFHYVSIKTRGLK